MLLSKAKEKSSRGSGARYPPQGFCLRGRTGGPKSVLPFFLWPSRQRRKLSPSGSTALVVLTGLIDRDQCFTRVFMSRLGETCPARTFKIASGGAAMPAPASELERAESFLLKSSSVPLGGRSLPA